MKTIEFKGEIYPAFQATGFAARFTFPFANEILFGNGYDIGCNRLEWQLPNTEERYVIPIDKSFNDEYEAMNLPKGKVDFIFSSHCLEHLEDWVGVLNYWMSKIKSGGHLYLYLPHISQKYWRPQNNRKHLHSFSGQEIENYFDDHKEVYKASYSAVDLNNSFTVIIEKI